MNSCNASSISEPVHGSGNSLNHRCMERLNRSLTIETSPRSMASDVEACTRILHPDGSVSTLDHVPEGTIKIFRYLPGVFICFWFLICLDQEKIARRS